MGVVSPSKALVVVVSSLLLSADALKGHMMEQVTS